MLNFFLSFPQHKCIRRNNRQNEQSYYCSRAELPATKTLKRNKNDSPSTDNSHKNNMESNFFTKYRTKDNHSEDCSKRYDRYSDSRVVFLKSKEQPDHCYRLENAIDKSIKQFRKRKPSSQNRLKYKEKDYRSKSIKPRSKQTFT